MNPLHQLMLMLLLVIESQNPGPRLLASESCSRYATASGIQILCKIDKEIFGGAFNEDVDLTGTPETFLRVETHQRWLASSQNVSGPHGNLFFDASCAQ